jgi:hypothetical protein
MNSPLKYFTFTCLVLSSVNGISQGDKWWNEYHFFGSKSTDKTSLWGSFDYQLKSNRLSNQILNEAIFDGRIAKATADQFSSENSNSTTYLSGGVIGDLWLRTNRPGKWNLLFGIGSRDMLYSSLKTGLGQLYLNGNGPYEDQELILGPSRLNYLSYQFLGFGTEYSNEKIIWGLSAQLIKTSRYQDFSINNSTLYTAPNGTYLEASLDFDYYASASSQPKASAWYGTGASLNTYLIYQQKPEGAMLSIQLNDVGFASFQGVKGYALTRDSLFSGVEINNILALDDALQANADLDSIEAILGITSSHKSKTTTLPGRLGIDFVQPLNQKLTLAIGARQLLFMGIPEIRLGMNIRAAKRLAFEPHFSFGGFSRFDYGLTVSSNPTDFLQLILKYDLLESQLNASNFTSQALFVGGQVLF